MTITQKELLLRNVLRREGIDAFITPSTDPHCGEAVPERWKSRVWITNMLGDAGTSVITTEKAALWADNRYHIAAAEAIKGTDYILMKDNLEGTPTISEWLGSILPEGSVVAVDGWVNTVSEVESLKDDLKAYGLLVRTDIDPYAEIWKDRPDVPMGKAVIHGLEYAGESATSKLIRIRKELKGNALLVSLLEDIAWTLNLRGNDIPYTPLVVSYLIITPTDATLYIKKEKLTEEVISYLKDEGVSIRDYDDIIEGIKDIDIPMIVDINKTNYTTYNAVRKPLRRESPIPHLLMFKNEIEIRGYRNAMEKDGVAMVKWMKWTLENVPKGNQTEWSLAQKLDSLRLEQPLCKDISFDTLLGYAHHGAIVHYHLTEESSIPVKPEGLLLCDSGGQYLDGTTDITRTIPLGPLTEDMKRDYTLVLKGWINLGRAVFPRGTNGTQLDGFARQDMWHYGMNYLHGTGHGVGQFMAVHECIDLHQFRMQWRPTPLLPGMTITDEPGIYIEGKYGVRHENTMLVVNANFSGERGKAIEPGCEPYDGDTEQGITYGPYYTFEHLTVAPVITSPIIKEMLTNDEIKWFNQYQQKVYDRLAPRLDEEHRQWLYEVTRPI